MKNKMMTVLLMALLLFNLCFIIHAEPETEQAVAEAYTTNRIIVKYKENAAGKASAPSLSVEPQEAQYTVKETLQLKKSKAEILEVNSTEEVSEVIAGLEADPAVEFAEPDYIVHANYDPSFDLQWGLNNTGQKMFGESGVAGQDINILPARAITQGEPSVIVAMVDGGMDIEHPDLDDNIFINDIEEADGYDNDDNGFIDDINGWNFADNNNNLMESYTDAEHGTHVAGIIAAESNNIGVEGVAPQVRILPLKFLKGNSGYTSDAIRAIEYAEKMGASIVNCSWGSSSPSSLLRETMANSDMLFVCAAGNYSSDAAQNGHYPANFDLENVISAVAMDNRGNVADFSNYGGNNTIAAPGKDIYSTAPNENYTFMNGTSMAAPFVTGVAALIKSENPTLTNGEIKDKIKSSATNSAKLTDMVQANGYLDAAAALNNTSDSQYVIESHEYGGKTVRVNRNIYSAGGYDENGYSNRLSFYNAVTKQWYQAPDMPTARIHAGMAAARNDLYVVGGYNGQLLDEVEKYNTLTKTWSEASSLPKALYASGVCCLNNKIFVFGGMDANGYSSAVYQYDPLEDVWQSASNMPVSAAYLSAVPVNDKIYLLAASNGDGPKDVIYEYHPEDDTYEQKASMAYRRQNASAVELDGTIYILGGSNENISDVQKNSAGKIAFTSGLTTVETYNPNLNTCEEIVDLPDSRLVFSAFEHNGEILLKGGWNGNYIDGTQAYIGAKVPLGLNAATNGSDIKLYWTEVEEATGYELEINGETVTVGSGVNEYTMTGESGYQVRIRSIFGDEHSAWSKYLVKQQYDTMRDAKQLVLSDTGLTEVIDTYPAGSSGIWFKTILESRGEGSIILACEQPERYKIELFDSSGNLIAESRFEENTQKIAAIPAGYPMLYIKISGDEITQNESITLTIHYTATGDDSEIPDRVYVDAMEAISPQDRPCNY